MIRFLVLLTCTAAIVVALCLVWQSIHISITFGGAPALGAPKPIQGARP